MLTFAEAQAACDAAQTMTADEFEKYLASFLPQTVWDQLAQEIVDMALNKGKNIDEAAHDGAMFNLGFHFGWVLCEHARGLRNES